MWDDPYHTPEDTADYALAVLTGLRPGAERVPPEFQDKFTLVGDLNKLRHVLLKLGGYCEDKDTELARRGAVDRNTAHTLLLAAGAAENLTGEELRDVLEGIAAAVVLNHTGEETFDGTPGPA